MRYAILAIACIILAGCTTCPPKVDQLILNVPAELLVKPERLNLL